MIGSRVRTYLNQDQTEGFSFFKQEEGFSALLKVPELLDVEGLESYFTSLSDVIRSSTFDSASDFDAVISDAFKVANLPLSFSISCLFIKEDRVFLKTFGQGSVFLRRQGKQTLLVKSGGYAAGNIQIDDEIVLSFGERDPFVDQDNSVHIEFGTEEVSDDVETEQIEAPTLQPQYVSDKTQELAKTTSSNYLADILRYLKFRIDVKKRNSLIIVISIGILILFVFIKSYNSKTAQEDRVNLENYSSTIIQKLEQAEDVFELNTGRSVALLTETRRDLKELEKKLHSPHKSETTQLEERIEATEKKILQKNTKTAEEFIDLGLEEKGAQGTAMWRYDDKVIIANPKGAVYILSLEKKSLEARSSSSITGASLAGLDESIVYVYKKGTGIIKIESESSKPKIAVKQDKDWGLIADLQVYNKNLYLLDSEKGQIYKYVPTEDGFATKSAYFKSGAYAQGASSFAIDQSVYVAQKKLITKYTSGLQDGFAPQYPDAGPSITRVVTGSDVESLYLWDKVAGRIVILSKNGNYEKTIESSIFSKATSVEVFADAAYALQGSKIYKVSLK